ncbi:MAG: hypothetical protein DRP12_00320 [Candidatus Aenigmatarchaeota archaeon]|nr:MAG: hypothetical protein DRP12_00320 [Candidatus Aenigmarchaeota archaeon]
MHERSLLELIGARVRELGKKKVRIRISELEVHDKGFKKELEEWLKKYFPDVQAEIEILPVEKFRGIKVE